MLLSGWKPSKICEWLSKHKKPIIAIKTLANYRNNYIDSKLILPISVYKTKLKEVDVVIDSLQELYDLVEIQKQRIGYLLDVEDQSKIALPDTREELKMLRDLLIKTVQLEMELGIRDKQPIEIIEKRVDITELLKDFMLQKQIMQDAIGP